MSNKRGIGERLFEWSNALFLILLGIATLYPFLYVLTISLSEPAAINRPGLHLYPESLNFSAYWKVLDNPQLYVAYTNTIIRTVLGIACIILFTSLTAYPLSRSSFPLRGSIMKLFVLSMMLNGGLIPMYLWVKRLGLLDSIWSLVLPGAVSAFNVIVMRNFFVAIPGEIIESAKIDGASELYTFRRIVMPLSAPVLAVVTLWAAVSHWNSWFDAMIYMSSADHEVLQLFLRHNVVDPNANLSQEYSIVGSLEVTPENLKSAIIMIVSFPILLAYPFLQRFFVKGIMLGSVKG